MGNIILTDPCPQVGGRVLAIVKAIIKTIKAQWNKKH